LITHPLSLRNTLNGIASVFPAACGGGNERTPSKNSLDSQRFTAARLRGISNYFKEQQHYGVKTCRWFSGITQQLKLQLGQKNENTIK